MVSFLPNGCSNQQAAECCDTTPILSTIDPEIYTEEVIYRCIFFESVFRDKEQKVTYFTVDKTAIKKP